MSSGPAITDLLARGLIGCLFFLLVLLGETRAPVNGRQAKEAIKNVVSHDFRNLMIAKSVCEHDHAKIIVREHGYQRIEPVNPAVMPDIAVSPVCGHHPTHAIAGLSEFP